MAGGNLNPQYAPLYVAAGQQYHIPPNVLAGVADVETNGGANISVSSAGAQGLMQFMPATASSLGVNPADPRSAIFGAAKLLNQYGYQSNPMRALGAYNGGPGNPQYSYAQQVMSSAQRLQGQFKGVSASLPGKSSGSAPNTGNTANTGGGTISVPTTQNTFDAAGYGKAKNEAIAGQYLKNEGKDPYQTGPKVPGGSGTGMLFSAGLSTTAPNPMDFQHAQTVLQQIALGGHASSGGSGPGPQVQLHPGGSTKGYVNPIPGATIGRTDMGVDANLPNGAPIRALGDSKVIGFSPNWYAGQPYMLMQLTSGPQAGKYWYVAEAIHPTVSAGQSVRAGQTIGTYYTGGTGIEMGWGSSTPGRTLAQEQGNTGDSSHGNSPAGVSFRNFLGSLH